MSVESARGTAAQQFIAAVAGMMVASQTQNKILLRNGNLSAIYWARAWHALGLPEGVTPAEMEQAITSLLSASPSR